MLFFYGCPVSQSLSDARENVPLDEYPEEEVLRARESGAAWEPWKAVPFGGTPDVQMNHQQIAQPVWRETRAWKPAAGVGEAIPRAAQRGDTPASQCGHRLEHHFCSLVSRVLDIPAVPHTCQAPPNLWSRHILLPLPGKCCSRSAPSLPTHVIQASALKETTSLVILSKSSPVTVSPYLALLFYFSFSLLLYLFIEAIFIFILFYVTMILLDPKLK